MSLQFITELPSMLVERSGAKTLIIVLSFLGSYTEKLCGRCAFDDPAVIRTAVPHSTLKQTIVSFSVGHFAAFCRVLEGYGGLFVSAECQHPRGGFRSDPIAVVTCQMR